VAGVQVRPGEPGGEQGAFLVVEQAGAEEVAEA
jgi:hypothetical protein